MSVVSMVYLELASNWKLLEDHQVKNWPFFQCISTTSHAAVLIGLILLDVPSLLLLSPPWSTTYRAAPYGYIT